MTRDLEDKVVKIGEILSDQNKPLKHRFRALFTLQNIGGAEAIACISKVFNDPSALLKHELAYCLGQMRDERAIPILTEVLKDESQHPMVRHEAGEAIGAIGSEEGLEVLRRFTEDPIQEVSETCQLALQRIEWVSRGDKMTISPYHSVDPAPPSDSKDPDQLGVVFLDETAPLFDRYRAMFALRNINSDKSISVLSKGLFCGSPLFRHEVAFVLGQLQSELSTAPLIEALGDVSQNEMVRHECAEALGSIASQECTDVLKKYLQDESQVVRESCEIALDMAEYEISSDFQYANTATLVC